MHISPLPQMHASEFTLKRALAYLSWQRKRKHRFSPDILQRLVEDIRTQEADHVLVTGDQCNLSLKAEFVQAAPWLSALGLPENVSVIPGNHDAHGRRREATWEAHWGAYMRGDDGVSGFPYLRRRGGVAIIGVSSAVPTALMMANGRVGAAQLARLRDVLLRSKAEGLLRVVLIHHPPQAGAAPWRKALSDAPALRAVLREAGAELVLHGHGHAAVRAQLQGPQGEITVRGCAAASSNGYHMPAAHYHRIRIKVQPEEWAIEITHRHYDAAGDGFVTTDEESLRIPRLTV